MQKALVLYREHSEPTGFSIYVGMAENRDGIFEAINYHAQAVGEIAEQEMHYTFGKTYVVRAQRGDYVVGIFGDEE